MSKSRKSNQLRKVKNFGFPVQGAPLTMPGATNFSYRNGIKTNLSNSIVPVQLERLRHDVSMWRHAVAESERAYYPFRVRMQRMFIDSILNGHVFSLMERRKDLTQLRRFEIVDSAGTPSEVLTQQLDEQLWFDEFISHSLDALFYGYSLISLGDIVSDHLQEVKITPRWFVSPDRKVVSPTIYSNGGISWEDPEYQDWHVYVKTKSDNGVSPCGYGLLYHIALYEIFLRNTLGYNGDFVELYAMPYRVGKTQKQDETERAEFEALLQQMGSAGYAMIDPLDDITFLESKIGGTGYQAYDNLEKRCQATVSKLILGHADAMDSIPGKLGNDAEESPAQRAMRDKRAKDGKNVQAIVNNQLAPRLQRLGLKYIPEGYRLRYTNDDEKRQQRDQEDKSNKATADIAQTMKNAGLKMDPKYFEERTGIPTTEIEEVEPDTDLEPDEEDITPIDPKKAGKEDKKAVDKIKNRLEKLYK